MPTDVGNASFCFTIHTDHQKQRTIMTWREYGEIKRETRYSEPDHFLLLVSIIEAMKGKGACDQPKFSEFYDASIPYTKERFTAAWKKYDKKVVKSLKPGGVYHNLPFHDVYPQSRYGR